MANFVSLGAGLREVGNIASGVGEFIHRERSLNQNDTRLAQGQQALDIQQRAEDERLRMAKNQEYGRQLLGVINEADKAVRPDGSRFNELGEYLASDEGAIARDRLANSLAASNSQFRGRLKGAPVRSTKTADGRFVVEAKDGDQWTPVQGDDGAPVSFTGKELAQKARLDAASAGIAELVYFKRDLRNKLASGALTQADYTQQVSDLDGQARQILTQAESIGIPADDVIETSRNGDPSNWQRPTAATEEPSRLVNAVKKAAPVLGQMPGLSGVLPAAGVFVDQLLGGPNRDSNGPDAPVISRMIAGEPSLKIDTNNRFIEQRTKMLTDKGLDPSTDETIQARQAENIRLSQRAAQQEAVKQPGGAQTKQPVAPPPWAAPLGPDADKLVEPSPENTRPAQQVARSARATQVVSRAMRPDASADDGRSAALQYANAMTIMGQNPDSMILANLYAGDDMRGSAAEIAQQELQYYKTAVQKQASNTQDFSNTLKLRKQIATEQETAAEAAAEKAVDPNDPNRSETVKQLKNAIYLGMSTHNNDLKIMGVDTTKLMGSMATLPMVADLLSKYYVEDIRAARHNSSAGWLTSKKQRTTVMNKVMKEVYVMDPEGFKRQLYLGLVAGREPGTAADDPKLIKAYHDTLDYYANMKVPTHGYDAAE